MEIESIKAMTGSFAHRIRDVAFTPPPTPDLKKESMKDTVSVGIKSIQNTLYTGKGILR